MVVVRGIIVAGYYKVVQPLPLQTLPFAQPDLCSDLSDCEHDQHRVNLLRDFSGRSSLCGVDVGVVLASCEYRFGCQRGDERVPRQEQLVRHYNIL